jgi:hypothetical protein
VTGLLGADRGAIGGARGCARESGHEQIGVEPIRAARITHAAVVGARSETSTPIARQIRGRRAAALAARGAEKLRGAGSHAWGPRRPKKAETTGAGRRPTAAVAGNWRQPASAGLELKTAPRTRGGPHRRKGHGRAATDARS